MKRITRKRLVNAYSAGPFGVALRKAVDALPVSEQEDAQNALADGLQAYAMAIESEEAAFRLGIPSEAANDVLEAETREEYAVAARAAGYDADNEDELSLFFFLVSLGVIVDPVEAQLAAEAAAAADDAALEADLDRIFGPLGGIDPDPGDVNDFSERISG